MPGVSALLVAFFPTTPPAGLRDQPPIIGTAHGVAALVLFAYFTLFPLLLFSQSKKKVGIYRWCGWLMLLFLGLIVAYALAPESTRRYLAPWRPVLLLEWLVIWAFGVSWLAKKRESAVNKAPTSHRTEEPAAV